MVGCGNISGAYLKMFQTLENVEIAACTDLIPEKAAAQAKEFGVPRTCTPEELMADPEIGIVLNLTVPGVHAAVDQQALAAGKHVYSEKPLAVDRDDGRRALEAAREKGLRVGCAPDTFLGAGAQTCRQLIDQGAIGEPVAAVAFFTCRGHETWHPNPEFYYKPGGGPMFDMGPYYLTGLINLLGPVRRITASASTSFAERLITSQPKCGQKIQVEVPTHVAGVLDFACGAVATIMVSFDVPAASLPRIEIYGAEGSLSVPDPNTFGGPVRLWRRRDTGWEEVPVTRSYFENSRGLGVADMAAAIRSGRPHRVSGEMAFHVLDIMQGFHEASDSGRHVELTTTCDRPAPLPEDLEEGRIDP
jgi:predicted dehydrogenase